MDDSLNARNLLPRISKSLRQLDKEVVILLFLGTVVAFMIRVSLVHFKSWDFLGFIGKWYLLLRHHGHTVFEGEFSNYNMPYLYVLYFVARWLPRLPAVVAVKIPSMLADFVCAGFVYKIVHLKRGNRTEALLGYMATLLSPTVILNGAYWGQADSIFSAGVLASLYGLLSKKPWFAMVCFGLALAFKLQAAFFLPFLFALWTRRALGWRHFLVVPVILFVAILPALLVGHPLISLLTVYWQQTQTYAQLTMNAPSLYAWLPASADVEPMFMRAGLFLAAALIAILVLLVWKSKAPLTQERLVQMACCCVLLVPFVLPEMHERYFFQADILSIVFAFYFPSYFYIPMIVNMASFFSYWPFLAGMQPLIPEGGLALAVLIAIMLMVRELLIDTYPAIVDLPGTDGGGARTSKASWWR